MLKQIMVGFDPKHFDWLGSALTLTFLLVFAGWTAWAFRPGSRARMDAASRIPLEGGE